MTGNFHVRFGGRERDVLFGGVTLPTQCGNVSGVFVRRGWNLAGGYLQPGCRAT
jgi:hypothetical protein